MRIRRLFTVLCWGWMVLTPLMSQVSNLLPSSIGFASVARQDVWTAFHNPAALVQNERFQVALQYENRYIVKELSNELVQFGYTNKYLNVGLAFSYFGFSKYNEMMASAVFAHSFNRFSIGLAVNYLALYSGSETGYKHTVLPQFGVQVQVHKKVCLGFQTFNPFLQSLKVDGAKSPLPSIYSLGVDYAFYPHFRWSTQFDYRVNQISPVYVQTGFEWQAVEFFVLRLGMYYHKYVVGVLGVDFSYRGLDMALNTELHPILGVNIMAKIGFRWL